MQAYIWADTLFALSHFNHKVAVEHRVKWSFVEPQVFFEPHSYWRGCSERRLHTFKPSSSSVYCPLSESAFVFSDSHRTVKCKIQIVIGGPGSSSSSLLGTEHLHVLVQLALFPGSRALYTQAAAAAIKEHLDYLEELLFWNPKINNQSLIIEYFWLCAVTITQLPSVKRHRGFHWCTSRLQRSFIPQAVTLLNSSSENPLYF